MQTEDPVLPNHHVQQELCGTRPNYRQGRKLTATKVYTINSESQHLYIYGVPSLNLRTELKNLFSKYGQIDYIHTVKDVIVEQFTECYHVCYKHIQSARISKRFLDNKNFYGGVLHVCYVPENETLEETRQKLNKRKHDILLRTSADYLFSNVNSDVQNSKFIHPLYKRKFLHSECETRDIKKLKIDTMLPHSSKSNLSSYSAMPVNIGPQLFYDPQIWNSSRTIGTEGTSDIDPSTKDKSNNKDVTPQILANNNNKQKKIVFKNKMTKLL